MSQRPAICTAFAIAMRRRHGPAARLKSLFPLVKLKVAEFMTSPAKQTHPRERLVSQLYAADSGQKEVWTNKKALPLEDRAGVISCYLGSEELPFATDLSP